MYLLPAVCLCAAVSGVFRAVFAVCDPAHEAVSAFCGGSAAGMGADSHRKPVYCPASPPLPALLCAGVPAADADFTAQECKCVLGVHPAQSIATVQTLRGSAAAANPSPQSTAAPSVPATAESSEPVESPETEEPPAATPQPDIADSAADAENFDGTYETTDFLGNATTLHGYDAANRHITISDAEFYTWMDVIWANPADYDGWTLTVTGEVDKSSREMDTDEFIPARLIMTCCAADLTPCGFVCKWAQADTLATGTWVTVTGTLYQRQYADHSEPQLQVQSVAPAEPVEGYIYPYY